MPKEPDFDVAAAHRFFSANCFNQAWEFIDKADRSPSEMDDMLHVAHASAWHWRQRPDCTNDKLSVSYWQLSRVYALAGESHRATRYGILCLEASQDQTPFLIGYAHEALARAASAAGDRDAAQAHLQWAREFLSQVTDPEERELLHKDIDSSSL
jgi:cation transport regulator ChaB